MTSLEIVGTGIEMGKKSPLGEVLVVSGSVQGACGGAHNGTTGHARCRICVGDSERLHLHRARIPHVEVELNLRANTTHPITALVDLRSTNHGSGRTKVNQSRLWSTQGQPITALVHPKSTNPGSGPPKVNQSQLRSTQSQPIAAQVHPKSTNRRSGPPKVSQVGCHWWRRAVSFAIQDRALRVVVDHGLPGR